MFNFLSRKKAPKYDDVRKIRECLADTKNRIDEAYKLFNMTDDEYMIESCIHEINSLNARYSYFLNQLKSEKSESEV